MEVAFLWLAELLFIVALAMFMKAWSLRRTTREHRRWAITGAALVFVSLVVLEIVKRGLGWEFPIRSRTMLGWHIGSAATSLVLLLTQILTGIFRWRRVHRCSGPLFLLCFTSTVVLSFFAFRLW